MLFECPGLHQDAFDRDIAALLEAIVLSDGGPRHQQIVQLLIDHGADIAIADKDGVTPLQHARQRGYVAIESILVQAGALK